MSQEFGIGEVFDNDDDKFLASTNMVSLVLAIISIPCTILVLCCLIYRYFKDRHKHARKYVTNRQLWKYLIVYCTLMLIGSDLLFELAYVPSRAALYVHNSYQNSTIYVGLIATTEAAEMFVFTSGTWSLFMMVAIVATTRYMYDDNSYPNHINRWKWSFAIVAWTVPLILAITRFVVNVEFQVYGTTKTRYISGLISDTVMSIVYGFVILVIFVIRVSIATNFNRNTDDNTPMQVLEKKKARKTFVEVAVYVYPFVVCTLCVAITRSWFDVDILYRLNANGFNYNTINVDPNIYERILYGTSCVLLPLRGLINACVYLYVDKHIKRTVKTIIARSQSETLDLIISQDVIEEAPRVKKQSLRNYLSEIESGRFQYEFSDDESQALMTPSKLGKTPRTPGIRTPLTPITPNFRTPLRQGGTRAKLNFENLGQIN